MSITESFYALRQFLNLSGTTGAHHECLDTIHAAMESLKGANVALEAEVVRIKGELEKAQAACAEMRDILARSGLQHTNAWGKEIEHALSSTCGTALLAEVKELREFKLAAAEANPEVGKCCFCGATIWAKNERMEDGRGMFHPVCGVKDRYESELSALREACKEASEAIQEWMDADLIVGGEILVAKLDAARKEQGKV